MSSESATSQEVYLEDLDVPTSKELVEIVKAMRSVINAFRMYPSGNQMIQKSIDRFQESLKKILQRLECMAFNFIKGDFLVNGEGLSPSFPENKVSKELSAMFHGRGVKTLMLDQAEQLEDFAHWLGLMSQQEGPSEKAKVSLGEQKNKFPGLRLNASVVSNKTSDVMRDKLSVREIVASMDRDSLLRELGIDDEQLAPDLLEALEEGGIGSIGLFEKQAHALDFSEDCAADAQHQSVSGKEEQQKQLEEMIAQGRFALLLVQQERRWQQKLSKRKAIRSAQRASQESMLGLPDMGMRGPRGAVSGAYSASTYTTQIPRPSFDHLPRHASGAGRMEYASDSGSMAYTSGSGTFVRTDSSSLPSGGGAQVRESGSGIFVQEPMKGSFTVLDSPVVQGMLAEEEGRFVAAPVQGSVEQQKTVHVQRPQVIEGKTLNADAAEEMGVIQGAFLPSKQDISEEPPEDSIEMDPPEIISIPGVIHVPAVPSMTALKSYSSSLDPGAVDARSFQGTDFSSALGSEKGKRHGSGVPQRGVSEASSLGADAESVESLQFREVDHRAELYEVEGGFSRGMVSASSRDLSTSHNDGAFAAHEVQGVHRVSELNTFWHDKTQRRAVVAQDPRAFLPSMSIEQAEPLVYEEVPETQVSPSAVEEEMWGPPTEVPPSTTESASEVEFWSPTTKVPPSAVDAFEEDEVYLGHTEAPRTSPHAWMDAQEGELDWIPEVLAKQVEQEGFLGAPPTAPDAWMDEQESEHGLTERSSSFSHAELPSLEELDVVTGVLDGSEEDLSSHVSVHAQFHEQLEQMKRLEATFVAEQAEMQHVSGGALASERVQEEQSLEAMVGVAEDEFNLTKVAYGSSGQEK
ncbi:MAG: hypothetical protein AAGJ35_01215, partial [Myxococcota bacterium]